VETKNKEMNSTSIIFEVVKFQMENDFFGPVYELEPLKIILGFLSISFVILLVPLLVSIIWFDWYGSDQKRIFINRLVSSIAFCFFAQLILIQIPEIMRYMTGPLPNWFCFWHYALKNTIAIQEILYFGIIAVVRYLFIFSIRNPATFQDEFWNFFINIQVVSFGFLSQVIFACLPGRQPLTFYFCTGDIPSGQ
jgi:hypothetical protein